MSAVRLGEWDLSTAQDCEDDYCADPVQDIPVSAFVSHENYNPSSKTQENDIALLRLAQPATFTYFIRPVCLPVAQHLRNKNYDGLLLEVAGWGKTENGKLKKILIERDVCV